MDLNEALEKFGEFGRFQALNVALLFLPVAHSAVYMLAFVFTTRDLPYRCFIPGCDDDTPATGWTELFPEWLSFAAPAAYGLAPVPKASGWEPDRCLRYSRQPLAGAVGCGPELFSNRTERCDRWVFPTDENTIVSEFKLTCPENKWKLTIVGTMIHLGQLFGNPLCGLISDKFGRRRLLLAIMAGSCALGVARSFAPSYATYIALVFADALVSSGSYSACFILGVELVGSRQRVFAGSVVGILSALGCLLLAALAWLQRDWRRLLRTAYVTTGLSVLCVWLLPESARWLVSRGRLHEAEKVLARMARMNRVAVPAPVRLRLRPEETSNALISGREGPCSPMVLAPRSGSDAEVQMMPSGRTWPLAQVFSSRRLLLRLTITAALWVINAFVYFGLAFRAVSLAGNAYLNFALSAVVEIPAYVFTWAAAERWGRRPSLSWSLALTSASMLAFIAVPSSLMPLQMTLYMIGKMGITVSFQVIVVFTAELFPTNARHSLLGICSTVARVGSLLATQTPLLEMVYWGLPMLLFGTASLGGTVLAVLLPETLNKTLPDNVRQAEEVGTQRKQKQTPGAR